MEGREGEEGKGKGAKLAMKPVRELKDKCLFFVYL